MKVGDARRIATERGDLGPLIASVPYASFLGLQGFLTEGVPRLHLPFRTNLIGNPRTPSLHGGVVAAFMETVALLHLMLTLEEHRIPKSVDFSIDYLRSARPVDCFASCDVTRLGRRVAQVQIRAWQAEENKPIALARSHFLLSESVEFGGADRNGVLA